MAGSASQVYVMLGFIANLLCSILKQHILYNLENIYQSSPIFTADRKRRVVETIKCDYQTR